MIFSCIEGVKALLSPPRCAHCYLFLEKRTILCQECSALLEHVVSVQLSIKGGKSVSVIAVTAYQEPLRSMIVAKHTGNRVASSQLADLIWEHSTIRYAEFDYIIPIPLHWTRFVRRGYNHAHVMAKKLADLSGTSVKELLKRSKRTRLQAFLSKDERLENLSGAFSLVGDRTLYEGKRLLLVDDLMTTGATLQEAATLLYRLKPASITAVVACRTRL
jgi:ComF family protein